MKPRLLSSGIRSAALVSRLAGWVFGLAFTPALVAAGAADPGSIQGRVFNSVSGEYVRNAQVRIQGTENVAVSEDGGAFRFAGIPPGKMTLVVSYTGYDSSPTTVTVLAGQTVSCDLEITSSLLRPSMDGTIVKLQEFVVSSEREGNAKAIMNQRNSMNITNSVASDVFGDIAEGNVGEFLKHIPGVELELVDGEARSPRLRGLDAEYTQVTLDGMSLASADAVGVMTRSFSFEQVSLNSMESIEIAKTISADSEANAPGGTINLKTKRAFDRKGRHFAWQTNSTAFSEEFHLRKNYGFNDGRSRKVLPGGILEYSDVFFNNRLGFVLNLSESNVFSAYAQAMHTYDYTPTAADPRPVVLTAVSLNHRPRTNERFTTTFTVDFKATPHLVLSLGLIYNYADLNYWLRQPTLSTGARNSVIGSSPLLSFTTSDAGGTGRTLTNSQATIVKTGMTRTYMPRFEYRRGDLTLEGKVAASFSVNDYEPFRRGGARTMTGGILRGGNFRAERSSLTSADWKITQLSGPDLADANNYTNTVRRLQDDGRYTTTDLVSGELTATLNTRRLVPIVWKTGVKVKEERRKYRDTTTYDTWDYIGPTSGAGVWPFVSPYTFDMNMTQARVTSLSGGTIPFFSQSEMVGLLRAHPEYFTSTPNAAAYYTSFVGNTKDYRERIDAAFLMGTARLGKLEVRGGLRWEGTETVSSEFDPIPASQVVAAGFPVASGRATTIPGLQYQYFSLPRVQRDGGYANFFPSASAKYVLRKNLNAHFGYSHTIRRPTFADVAGVWAINEDMLTVTAPNPNLKPEMSDNYSARLAYYFEPVGTIGFNLFYNRIDGLGMTNRYTAAEFGYGDDPDFSAYTFISTISSAKERWVRGMEVEYSQSLSFLRAPFNGLNVRASYTRNYADALRVNVVPHAFSSGFSYSWRRLSLTLNATWTDDTPWNIEATRYRRHRAVVDGGGSWRLTDRTRFFFTARNLMNAPLLIMEKVGENPAAARQYDVYGTMWTFGLKGSF